MAPNHGYLKMLSCLFLALQGCGDFGYESASEDGYSGNASDSPPELGLGKEKVILSGSVVSAFQIMVDGKVYQDSEDFYTQEIERLSEKVSSAGYQGWTVRFEAVLGFSDIARGMQVFIAPVSKTGNTANESASSDGRFRFELPSTAKNAAYNIRAVKRVNVVLTRGGESRKFCYNFSAVGKDIVVKNDNLPIVLDTFTTQLTTYSCDSDGSQGGITIPAGTGSSGDGQNESPSTVNPGTVVIIEKIAVGENADSVVNKFGDPDSVTREYSWSIYYRPNYDWAWKYERFPDSASKFNCTIYLKDQKVIAYTDCPASRIDFSLGAEQAASQPSARISARDPQQAVLTKWGLPSIVTLATNGIESRWEYIQSPVTSEQGSCVLKFNSGVLINYEGVCRLGWLAHWTF